ncbi:DUF5694 domain-containing protein [Caulobacter sp. X]|uniref:DUF5694 domain-containing protein n=1 Tax=Caulobacter sp. X TaxID=2048901 RepID=UPI000C157F5E|nr:DUF5694 domain-containing protein [Caulobacter sp. X]PIB95393.1 hypothetical protein CSW60_12325 [Caulobacter sp. X]
MFRTIRILAAAVTLASMTAVAQAGDYRPSFHPDTLKGPPRGAPNAVMVLGTPHLSGLPKTFDMARLSPLLEQLAAWKPTGVATESLSGLQCDALRRYPARYAETVKSYCPDPSAAGKALGLDVPAANAEAERLLAAWPAEPSAAQRRRLAAVFLAAGERGSALVQWLRLPEAERKAGEELNDELVALLEKIRASRNETYSIAAVLAARLGHERLWSVDDHTADTAESADPAELKAFETAIRAAWDNPVSHARRAEDTRLQQDLDKPDGVLNLYRVYNGAKAQRMAYEGDFGAALRDPSPQGFGRQYVGYWETRNLRMVANIRDVLGQHPGMRLLAIVGASHKGYYEAYLNQMHDVRLVDVQTALR